MIIERAFNAARAVYSEREASMALWTMTEQGTNRLFLSNQSTRGKDPSQKRI